MGNPKNVNGVQGHRHQQYIQPPPPKPKPMPATPKTGRNELADAATKRTDTQNYGNQQKARLNAALANNERRDNSALIGGTAGSTAAQFELSEQSVRNTGIIKVKGDATTPADFVGKVERDIQKLAPNSKLELRPPDSKPYYQKLWDKMYGSDTLAVVRRPENVLEPRVSGHEQGYRLLDQLHNNPNEVTINYKAGDAYAAPRNYLDSFGKVTAPNKGSAVDVHYDPDLSIGLPVKNANGSLTSALSDSAIILGHEFGHASHMQRGTQQNVDGALLQDFGKNQTQILGTQGKENVFSGDGKFYREGDNMQIGLREEFRNVGTDGHRYGSEPTENSLRSELGIPEKRISYQENANNAISPFEARVNQVSTRAQTFGDNVLDGVKGSRNSALIGAGFNTAIALYEGKDAKGVATDAAIGAGTGITDEVIQKTINGARATTTGMTENAFRTAASQVKGAAVAGAVVNTAFAVYDQMGNLQDDAMRSQAVGTIAGEAVVGAASGAAGAYTGALAGAAIGSIVPGVGTLIGGVIGFAVGAGVGYLTDKGLRGLGVDKAIAQGVTATYDAVADFGSKAGEAISNTASNLADGAKHILGGAVRNLGSIFG